MNLPSVKTLQRINGGISRITAQTLRLRLDLCKVLGPERDWSAERTLDGCACVLNSAGSVEALFGPDSCTRPVLLYINLGDTYDTTLLYEPSKNRFSVGSWGDYAERHNL